MRSYGKAELAVVLDGVLLRSNLMGAVDVNAAELAENLRLCCCAAVGLA